MIADAPVNAMSTPSRTESVPAWYLLEAIERDPGLTELDRAWFRDVLIGRDARGETAGLLGG
jgi:hypothetical protein